MAEFIVINGHAPWCASIRTLHLDDDEPCDCRGWDDDDPCRCGAWDLWNNDHTKAEHTDCEGSLHNGVTPCGGCDECVSAQVSYYARRRTEVPDVTA
jgi:hypothetical protein